MLFETTAIGVLCETILGHLHDLKLRKRLDMPNVLGEVSLEALGNSSDDAAPIPNTQHLDWSGFEQETGNTWQTVR